MTKQPRTTSARISPPDRDGDGRPGGSLPGNKTIQPPQEGEGDPNDGDGPVKPTDQEKLEAMERETDEANAAVRAAAGWTRDEGRLLLKLDAIGARFSDLSTEAVVQSWTDQEAFAAETFADAMAADGAHLNDEGEHCRADGTVIDLPVSMAEWEIDFVQLTMDDSTFTPEEIAAGKTPVVQEDEAETTAAEVAPVIDAEDPIITVETPTAPVAVRVQDLQRLAGHRFFYRSAEGYSPNYAAPFVDQATIDVWTGAGLAEISPSAGNAGGVRITPEARSVLTRHRRAAHG